MKGNLQVILISVALFAGGLLIGVWTQRVRPLPPPPLTPMGEFAHRNGYGPLFAEPPHGLRYGHNGSPPSPEEIRARMAAELPRIAAFQKNLDDIEGSFRGSVDAMLNPAQRDKLVTMRQRFAHRPSPPPGCDIDAGRFFVSMVIYRPVLDHLTKALNLDEKQQGQLKQLLVDRRNRLITLVDQTPPPSLRLGEIMRPSDDAGRPH